MLRNAKLVILVLCCVYVLCSCGSNWGSSAGVEYASKLQKDEAERYESLLHDVCEEYHYTYEMIQKEKSARIYNVEKEGSLYQITVSIVKESENDIWIAVDFEKENTDIKNCKVGLEEHFAFAVDFLNISTNYNLTEETIKAFFDDETNKQQLSLQDERLYEKLYSDNGFVMSYQIFCEETYCAEEYKDGDLVRESYLIHTSSL